MKRVLIYIFILSGLFSCNSSSSISIENIIKCSDNIEIFKGALSEVLKISRSLNSAQIDSILKIDYDNKFKNLEYLYKNEILLNNNQFLCIEFIDKNLINFNIYYSENNWIGKLITGRKTRRLDILSFDKEENWKETRSIIGQVDDTGFNELKELENNWYYVSTWSTD